MQGERWKSANNKFFCIWAESDCFMLEDVNQKVLLSLHPSQFLWFENHMVEFVQNPVYSPFFYQFRIVYGTSRIHKIRISWSWFVEWIVWPITGGRTVIVLASSNENGWLDFCNMVKNFSVRNTEGQM